MQSSVTDNKKLLLYANITVEYCRAIIILFLFFEICDLHREISYLSDN